MRSCKGLSVGQAHGRYRQIKVTEEDCLDLPLSMFQGLSPFFVCLRIAGSVQGGSEVLWKEVDVCLSMKAV